MRSSKNRLKWCRCDCMLAASRVALAFWPDFFSELFARTEGQCAQLECDLPDVASAVLGAADVFWTCFLVFPRMIFS